MGIWNILIGRKVHCTGCGAVVPVEKDNRFEEIFCSDACERNFKRISSMPPPPSEEEFSEVRRIPFADSTEEPWA